MGQTQDFPFDIEDITELLRLRIRRRCADGVYTDCPFCGDNRGKMKVSYVKNVWRCNYCGESGGMLKLYAKARGITTSEAYREICDAIQNGVCFPAGLPSNPKKEKRQEIPQSARAENPVIHQTLSGLLGLLKLSERHREHLRTVRGLTDEQIDRLGYKSTPPFYLCGKLANQLIAQGYTVEGVPGFYQKYGKWTVNFSTITAGFLIPVRGIDGMIHGCQIRLDIPLKNDNDPPEKEGAKYIWLSSGSKPMGVSSGSPVHFVGDPFARVVYVTEGFLKADVSHCLSGRTFVATAGANNTEPLKLLFSLLAANGTEMIVEAEDMDKYRNEQIYAGASKVSQIAKTAGMECRRLTWNPNYKGFDDWQLAIKQKSERRAERMNFKTRFLYGLCDFDAIDEEVAAWHEAPEQTETLEERLGFTNEEQALFIKGEEETLLKMLLAQRCQQAFRIYQLRLDEEHPTAPFAFGGIEALHKAGFEQPPAAEYNRVYDGVLFYISGEDKQHRLKRIFEQYNDDLPDGYPGRSIAPSDVIELYDDESRRYYYCDTDGFCPVKFSPMLAKPLKQDKE